MQRPTVEFSAPRDCAAWIDQLPVHTATQEFEDLVLPRRGCFVGLVERRAEAVEGFA